MQAYHGRVCSVCGLAKADEVRQLIADGKVSKRRGARMLGVTESALRRCLKNHTPARDVQRDPDMSRVPDMQAQSLPARVHSHDQTLLGLQFEGRVPERTEILLAHVTAQLRRAESRGDARTALAAAREIVRVLELQAKLSGDIGGDGVTNVGMVVVQRPGDPEPEMPPHFNGTLVVLPDNGRDAPDFDGE